MSHQQTAEKSISFLEGVGGPPSYGPSESASPGVLVDSVHVWVERY